MTNMLIPVALMRAELHLSPPSIKCLEDENEAAGGDYACLCCEPSGSMKNLLYGIVPHRTYDLNRPSQTTKRNLGS